MLRICLGCRKSFPLTRGVSRCPTCEQVHNRKRHAERPQYGPGWRAVADAVIAAESWCHWPNGCQHPDAGTPANPLTCEHIVAVAHGGTNDPSNLTVLCRRHNSEKGGQTRALV